MSAALRITRAGPLVTLQDSGRPGMLRHGVSASGPMDRGAYLRAGGWIGGGGATAIEFTAAGLGFAVEGDSLATAYDGASFVLAVNGVVKPWPGRLLLREGDLVDVTPGPSGNYGYLRFDREIAVPRTMGSRATNLVAGLGGFDGRALRVGDRLQFGEPLRRGPSQHPRPFAEPAGSIRIVWGVHADLFANATRQRLITEGLLVSPRLDRMGVRLDDPAGVFAGQKILSLVSDAIVPGDIQILGDGAPIVLMRDHQPTGGYPRIATVIGADLDRFAQMRPGSEVRFAPVTVAHAQAILGGKGT